MRISDWSSDVCSSDLIVRGGENISPGEIEDVLMTHPAIADAAAVAVPSVEWGEAVGIAVVTRPGHAAQSEDELKRLIKSGRASARDRVCQSVKNLEVAGPLKKKVYGNDEYHNHLAKAQRLDTQTQNITR